MDEVLSENIPPFYERPQVQVTQIPVGGGLPIGIERVSNPQLGLGGAYGSWGVSYDNDALQVWIEEHLGKPLLPEERMDLSSLGFLYRHQYTHDLTPEEYVKTEIEVGAQFLREAAHACGWEPGEVQAVLLGVSGPVSPDYTELIAKKAGIPENVLKVSVHKACDGSVGALHLALNPELGLGTIKRNLADELRGKKVLVGGIEGLSRFVGASSDKNALQFFGNGAGVIGVIPGETITFLSGKTHEVFDEEGVLAIHMYYPHSGQRTPGQSNVEVSEMGDNQIRVAGLMHEPADGKPIAMAGMMGMVKIFVRTGAQVVQEVYGRYVELMERRGTADKGIRVAVVHHANLKIKKLKEKYLQNAGIHLPMPWLLTEFGNVSAASNMIAFLRQLPRLNPGDHILIDGFGAGTYYDAMIVALGE